MIKTEDRITFYEQLYKSLDDESDDETELCQITGSQLDSKCVTLECKHKFNYEPLYKEIYRQKFVFNSYDWVSLSNKDKLIISCSGKDYFIRCPYCRNIQFSVLPYYSELGLKKTYGINCLDDLAPDKPKQPLSGPIRIPYGSDDYQFNSYGKLFKKGICVEQGCQNMYVTILPNTELRYCHSHYKYGLNKWKVNNAKEKQELLDKKNKERAAQGLKLLKRLPPVKKQNVNVVQQGIQVGTYVPEAESLEAESLEAESLEAESLEVPALVNKTLFCKAVLKTGINKGKPCGCKKIESNGLCKRHQEKVNLKEEKESVINQLK